MKQYLLAAALVAAPVAVFTAGYGLWNMTHAAPATAGLGDMSTFEGLVAEVQKLAASGDLAGAAVKVRDYESAWDQAETALRPRAPDAWGAIDEANDAAFSALRAQAPDATEINTTLQAVMDALKSGGAN